MEKEETVMVSGILALACCCEFNMQGNIEEYIFSEEANVDALCSVFDACA